MVDVIRYHNEYDWFYNDLITFNKGIVYNNKQCSGLLHFIVNDKNKMDLIGKYPKVVNDGTEILTTNKEGTWSFNDFYDATVNQYNNLPFFKNNCANSNKELNGQAFNYKKPDLDKPRLRSDSFNVRLINDKYSNYKFIMKYVINKSNKSNV